MIVTVDIGDGKKWFIVGFTASPANQYLVLLASQDSDALLVTTPDKLRVLRVDG